MKTTFINAYGEKMKLTSEQQKCIGYEGDKTLLVKGYAGTGKSVFIQQMALKSLERSKENKIAIFTLCHTLTSATNDIMKKLCTAEEYDRIEVRTLIKYLLEVYRDMGGDSNIVYDSYREKLIKQALFDHKIKYGEHRFQSLSTEFWAEEIDWMKGMDVSTGNKEYYLSLERKGRGGEVRMTQADRVEAYRIFTLYEKLLKNKKLIDWEDVPIYITRHKKDIPESRKFDYVLIDEAQDFSLATIRAVCQLFRCNLFIGMDANQRVYSRHWTPKQVPLQTITKKLSINLRNTIQIDSLAESLRKHNDEMLDEDDKTIRDLPDKTGNIPVICRCETIDDEKNYVTEIVKRYLKEYRNKISIGIITSKKSLVSTFSTWMADAEIYHEEITKDSSFSMLTHGVKIANLYNAKGLEFDVVIIPQFVEGVYPYKIRTDDTETIKELLVKYRNLAYVSMTRAKQMLYITFSGDKASRFIDEMDPELYEKDGLGFDTRKTGNVKLPPMVKKEKGASLSGLSLKDFFISKGLKVIDKRDKGGCLWVIGEKTVLAPILKEAKEKYNAVGTYSENGGKKALGPCWMTKCTR